MCICVCVFTAIHVDGCNVVGYTAWSLMDNFEWLQGYVEKFGMHHVDFDDVTRPRTAKDSALYYKQVVADNGFPDPNGGAASDVTARGIIVPISSLFALLLWYMYN